MSVRHPLIDQNVFFLQQGMDLLQTISDDIYSLNDHPLFRSGIGRHMRHVLDHYSSFLRCMDGQIDYDSRNRDLRLEKERSIAIETGRSLVKRMVMLTFPTGGIDAVVVVRCNDDGSLQSSSSTFKRELQFLVSHTVHHYALIALILNILELDVPVDFGVAPSTLNHQSNVERSCAQ